MAAMARTQPFTLAFSPSVMAAPAIMEPLTSLKAPVVAAEASCRAFRLNQFHVMVLLLKAPAVAAEASCRAFRLNQFHVMVLLLLGFLYFQLSRQQKIIDRRDPRTQGPKDPRTQGPKCFTPKRFLQGSLSLPFNHHVGYYRPKLTYCSVIANDILDGS
jgi:hypothetical protein